ncbi:helix-turn-helix transcriptional regulator [Microbacterium sp. No. 7]|uniref:helix-turn-helix transcriptional regulator n=1 Tax=Microbacterium sp. No. 7 TaxID=1714373 RepID=UPI0006D00A04|nr:WYL domain-containing protein [Microbacterium sp. No. 7]ALJ20227.1 transcriptional regulator [Microbacterium sp. No. 7]
MSERLSPATDRAALILQLVPYLIARGEVSLEEAAEAFDVSPGQMREMVEKLTVIGLPGDGGFWQMANDLFDIDWDLLDEQGLISITNSVGLERSPRLTAGEAAALLAGLQLAASLPGVGDGPVIKGLLAKLARGAAAAPADVIVAPTEVDEARRVVGEALQRGVAVSFAYKAPDAEPTTRTVDPARISIADGQWYLQGWCHLRQAMRTFHVERISDVRLTDTPISHRDVPVPALFEPSDGEIIAELRVAARAARLLTDALRGAVVTDDGDHHTLRVRVADPCSLRRLAARHAREVEIVAPGPARAAAHSWAARALEQYR